MTYQARYLLPALVMTGLIATLVQAQIGPATAEDSVRAAEYAQ